MSSGIIYAAAGKRIQGSAGYRLADLLYKEILRWRISAGNAARVSGSDRDA